MRFQELYNIILRLQTLDIRLWAFMCVFEYYICVFEHLHWFSKTMKKRPGFGEKLGWDGGLAGGVWRCLAMAPAVLTLEDPGN